MGIASSFPHEKLMVGLLFHQPEQAEQAKALLCKHFGAIDLVSEVVCFSKHSTYYDKEMNGEVFRQFISFRTLVNPEALAAIKVLTNQLEQQFMHNNLRPINLDPGLINTGRLVLATTKAASHRIALAQGIYGELTLFYSKKMWHPLPWTYPDFRDAYTQQILSQIRKQYRENIREN